MSVYIDSIAISCVAVNGANSPILLQITKTGLKRTRKITLVTETGLKRTRKIAPITRTGSKPLAATS
jgi:hypothetical protein